MPSRAATVQGVVACRRHDSQARRMQHSQRFGRAGLDRIRQPAGARQRARLAHDERVDAAQVVDGGGVAERRALRRATSRRHHDRHRQSTPH